MKVWLVALVIALAGCSSPDSDADPKEPGPSQPNPSNPGPSNPNTPTGPVDMLLDFNFLDCQAMWFGKVDDGGQQALLPEGYTAAGQLVAVVASCGNFTTPTVAVPNTWFGFVGIEVENPGFGGTGMQIYATEILAGEDVLGQLWPLAGFETLVKNGSLSRTGLPAPLPGVDTYCLTICISKGGDPTAIPPIISETIAPATELPPAFTLYQETEDYRLQWTSTVVIDQATGEPGSADLSGSNASGQSGEGGAWQSSGDFTNMDLIAVYP